MSGDLIRLRNRSKLVERNLKALVDLLQEAKSIFERTIFAIVDLLQGSKSNLRKQNHFIFFVAAAP